MRRAGILFIGLVSVAALLMAANPADARPRFGPRALMGVLAAPLGMTGLYHLRARHAHRSYAGRRATPARARQGRAMAAGGLGAAAAERHLATQASWSGPAFWPAAAADMLGYTARAPGYEPRFWGGGFADVLAGVFSQSDDRVARGRSRPLASADDRTADRTTGAGPDGAAKTCGPSAAIDDIAAALEQTVRPKPAQQAAFRDLKAAMVQASDDLKSACPNETPLTPLARLNAMQQRLWAIQSAARVVRGPFANLVSLLDDEQKARVNASAAAPPPTRHASRRGRGASQAASAQAGPAGPAQICYMQSRGASEWPIEQIRERVRPNEAQQASLKTLAESSGNMAKLLIASCPQQQPASALDRIDAVLARLDSMLYAIGVVDPPLQGFYGGLSDEQKARFNSLGMSAGS